MPNTKILNERPTTSASRFKTVTYTTGQVAIGSPIGLLLALTYAVASASSETLSGEKPNTSINND